MEADTLENRKSCEETLVSLLAEHKLTITTAESCTGGMISSTIVNVPGASSVLAEAYVTYSNGAKEKLLGVKGETLDRFGAVSEETAREMAEGAARAAEADCAVAVTGIAGPDGGTREKPVGTVYAGFYVGGEVFVRRYLFAGDRYSVREQTSRTALKECLDYLIRAINDGRI